MPIHWLVIQKRSFAIGSTEIFIRPSLMACCKIPQPSHCLDLYDNYNDSGGYVYNDNDDENNKNAINEI